MLSVLHTSRIAPDGPSEREARDRTAEAATANTAR